MFFLFAHEFHWTPEQVRWLTIQEVTALLDELGEYRRYIPGAERCLYDIRVGLLGSPADAEDVGRKLGRTNLPQSKASAEDLKAWEAAGYKGKLDDFIKQKRSK